MKDPSSLFYIISKSKLKGLECLPAICEGYERRQNTQQNTQTHVLVCGNCYVWSVHNPDMFSVTKKKPRNSGLILLMLLLVRTDAQLTHFIIEVRIEFSTYPVGTSN